MKHIFFISLLLFSTGLFSQNQGSLKGTISDKTMNNEPLLMANIQIKGQEVIAQTNFHGNFEISDIPTGTYTLVISYLGYETKKIPITIEENIVTNIAANLSTLQIDLDDVLGMDTASNDQVAFPSNTEKNPRK